MFFRLDTVNRSHNSNNFAEASIRILKNVILNRQAACNTAAFAEFYMSMWKPYMLKQLLLMAHSRDAQGCLGYQDLMDKCFKLDASLATRAVNPFSTLGGRSQIFCPKIKIIGGAKRYFRPPHF